MKLCIDDANVERIRHIYAYFPVDGVSTNPSILAKTGRTPYEVLKEIRSIIGEEGELFESAYTTIGDLVSGRVEAPAWGEAMDQLFKVGETPAA